MRHRPIYGGAFGKSGRFLLATTPCIERGLHSVRFSVLDPTAGSVLSVSNDKRQALDTARRRLRALGMAADAPPPFKPWRQGALWPDEQLPTLPRHSSQRKRVSRRRMEVFRRSDGRCVFCNTTLQIEGPWEADHAKPRALGGSDEPLNLYACCVQCNRRKRDRTAIEFVSEAEMLHFTSRGEKP